MVHQYRSAIKVILWIVKLFLFPELNLLNTEAKVSTVWCDILLFIKFQDNRFWNCTVVAADQLFLFVILLLPGLYFTKDMYKYIIVSDDGTHFVNLLEGELSCHVMLEVAHWTSSSSTPLKAQKVANHQTNFKVFRLFRFMYKIWIFHPIFSFYF